MADEQLDRILKKTLEDFRISRGEKRVLKSILDELDPDAQRLAFIRHRAFEIARSEMLGPEAKGAIDWLEDIVKILQPDTSRSDAPDAEAYFSPGDSCVRAIIGLLRRARRSVDICVFTITDNRLSDAILETAERRVGVRIISDNDKSEDLGSDIERFGRAGIDVVVDQTRHHMHHKFAIFDNRITLTGSYNWTRSAAENNEENIVVTRDARITRLFQGKFNQLWRNLQ
ncbi:MAG: phospholipase D-like domain-containing protein [Pirellulaceae bacterium]|jgi:phosphatidylserine/phosphatidylglycerophosphate/cardiolipin synthase-like enzyme|nr:phospholipase D-like domain-containing protein [Pirellulaceae bacterium]